MAIRNAVRRSGSLLLRAAAVGGLAGVAWLLGAGAAAAAPDDPADEVVAALESVLSAVQQHRGEAAALLDEQLPPPPPRLEVTAVVPAERVVVPIEPGASAEFVEVVEPDPAPVVFYSGGHQAPGRSGGMSNAMPAEAYQAKVAAKAAARTALVAPPAPAPVATAPAPPPPPPPAPVSDEAAPQTRSAPVAAPPDAPPAPDLTWENPEPSAPSPAPQHAPAAPSAPSASSSTHDSSNGHRGGGTVASPTAQSALQPSTAWSVERRDDWRSPGSVPGLPSTSPD